MDDITLARVAKFQRIIASLKPKSKAVMDFFFAGEINLKEINEPTDAFDAFTKSIIALNQRNNGNFTIEEVDAIQDIHDKFQLFFEESELSTGLVDHIEAANRAHEQMTDKDIYGQYWKIMDVIFILNVEHFIENQLPEDRAKIEDIIFMKPKSAWQNGIFGMHIEFGKVVNSFYNESGFPFIMIKNSQIANHNRPI